MFLGIDLGTTNTVVSRSFIDANNKLVTEVVQIGQVYNDNWEKYITLPSMVYFDEEDNIIVGREAKRQREWDAQRVVTNAKRFMGTQRIWTIDNIKYEAKDIAAIVLQHCKKTIEREGNMKYDSVVITVPASFNPDQIGDTLKAAKQAGFPDEAVTIKHEPTAALLSFINGQAELHEDERYIDFSDTKRILVFDLGGGTCDTSVIDVKVGSEELSFTEVAIGRYQELGGIDFDAKVATALLNKFYADNCIEEGMLNAVEQDVLYKKLLLAAETVKEKLSAKINNQSILNPDMDIENVTVKHNIPNFYKETPLRLVISKHDYDVYTESLYKDSHVHYKKFEDMEEHKNILGVIRKTLEDYDIKKKSIDYVFMTGGMSQFITVRQKTAAYIGKPLIAPENPMDAVARGASIYQYYKVLERNETKRVKSGHDSMQDQKDIDKKSEGIVDTMMLAEAVLLDMYEGLPKVIIPKKTVVPYAGEIIGEFRTTSPAGIKLNIYAAENEKDSSMRLQKCIEKPFDFPVKSGTPFDIKYRIDENKAIAMQIIVNSDMYKQKLDISIHSDLNIKSQDYQIIIDQ